MSLPLVSRRGFLFGAGAAMSGLEALPLDRLVDRDGTAFGQGQLDFFLTGSTTRAPVYRSADLSTPLPNPIMADAQGALPPIFLDPALTYRVRARTSAGEAIAGMDFDPISASNARDIGYAQNDRQAVARSLQSKLGDVVNLLDFHEPARGRDVTDALERLLYRAFPDLPALEVHIPAGNFTVSRQIIIGRQVTIRGAGMYATVLDFHDLPSVNPTMRGAIAIGPADSLAAYDPAHRSKIGEGSSYSTLEDLQIKISGTRPPGMHYGLWTAGRVQARNLILSACGFKAAAGNSLTGGPGVLGNVDQSDLYNVTSVSATEHAFVFDGGEAQTCRIFGCNAFLPARIGFYEASAYGNTYLGCVAHGGGRSTSGYKTAGSALGTPSFIGCYCENDFTGAPWDLGTGALILQPQGVFPQVPGATRNACIASVPTGGLWANGPITLTEDPTPNNVFSVGDATHRAARFQPDGLSIRGYDNALHSITASASFSNAILINMKLPGPYPDNAAARRAGLAAGQWYRVTTTNAVAVVA
jgi:hypothetical protein